MKRTLFNEILKLTTGMLLLMIVVVTLLFYLFLSPTYRHFQRNQMRQMLDKNTTQLEMTDSILNEVQALINLLSPSQAGFTIKDDNNQLIFEHYPRNSNLDIFSGEFDISINSDFSLRQPAIETDPFQYTVVEFSYTNQLGSRTLEIRVPSQPLNDARQVMLLIFPIVSLLAIFFALAISLIFSKWISIPIKKITKITSIMTEFKPVNLRSKTRINELNELQTSIFQLYDQLNKTIFALEQELKRARQTENQKIDFLQTVSHELKTPLTSANSLIEGIRYNISPYANSPNVYLAEVQKFLEKAITLTNESLKLTEIGRKDAEIFSVKEVIKEIISTYDVIIQSKNIHFSKMDISNIKVKTNKNLFEKIFSNLYSNAVYHNHEHGSIEIVLNNGILSIFNSGDALSEEVVRTQFLPLVVSNQSKLSSGIGLYVSQQWLQYLEIPFTFKASQKKDGMIFSMDLNDKIIKETSDDLNS